MLTAQVVDASPAARRQVTSLLQLAGWGVHEAADTMGGRPELAGLLHAADAAAGRLAARRRGVAA
jgi:hypothetical protein